MTNEQAIAMLKRIQEPEAWEPQINQAAFEALDMAIKALERQPCEDAVSKENLLKMYEDRFIELQKAHRKDTQLGVNWCINTLKDMPPVTPVACIATVKFSKEDMQELVNEKMKDVVAERKKGKWIRHEEQKPLKYGYELIIKGRCSNCGESFSETYKMHYCPNCGAEMENGE